MTSNRFQTIIAIFCYGLASFTLAALFSYTPTDPSWLSVSMPPIPTSNFVGQIGANIAAGMFFLFGSMAFLSVLIIAAFGSLVLRHPLGYQTLFGAIRLAALFLATLAVSPLVTPNFYWNGFGFSSGGIIGEQVSSLLVTKIGELGVIILVLIMIVIALEDWLKAQLSKVTKGLATLWAHLKSAAKNGIATAKPHPEPVTNSIASESFKDAFNPHSNTHEPPLKKTSQVTTDLTTTTPEALSYSKPNLQVFSLQKANKQTDAENLEHMRKSEELTKIFATFGVNGAVKDFQPGPVITVYEFQPTAGTKLSKLTALADDIALALRVDSVFIHPVSGKTVVGIQVPNQHAQMVNFGELIRDPEFEKLQSPLSFVLGKNLRGDAIFEDLAAMPHLLMAGQTGSGKSVAINTLLCSLLTKSSPSQVRLVLVDPKILELKVYEGIPHLMVPVITEPSKAAAALKWACHEMDERYKIMEQAKVRHIQRFNELWNVSNDQQRHALQLNLNSDRPLSALPYIVIVIDELADLMLTASRDVESSIQRLAQKARACGIHLVLATQRPSVDIITGVIKANLPSRISFKVFSRTDSRTILDSMGAERLLGRGDMLSLKPGMSRLERIQGAFVSDSEVNNFIASIRNSSSPNYDKEATSWIEREHRSKEATLEPCEDSPDRDSKWQECLELAARQGFVSASFLQRHLKIGYNRAARIVELMETQGLVSKADGSRPRKWLAATSDMVD